MRLKIRSWNKFKKLLLPTRNLITLSMISHGSNIMIFTANKFALYLIYNVEILLNINYYKFSNHILQSPETNLSRRDRDMERGDKID